MPVNILTQSPQEYQTAVPLAGPIFEMIAPACLWIYAFNHPLFIEM